MSSTKVIFVVVLGLNLLALIIAGINTNFLFNPHSQTQTHQKLLPVADEPESEKSNEHPYSFDDPIIAHYLLEQLDVFSTIGDKEVNHANYTGKAFGLKYNNNYCRDHREYFVNHPEEMFYGQKYITNFYTNHKVRSHVVNKIGKDLQPEINPVTAKLPGGEFKYDQRVDANFFFTINLFFYYRQLGKQFSCITQASNHIPGHDNMYRKDNAAQALVSYAKSYKARPECFNYRQYFPKTWILTERDQCKDFFKEFNSPLYQRLKEERSIVYFRKIGADVHEGHGVFPVTDEEEVYIRELYGNGTKCGQVRANNLIQYNVHDLMLLEGRKFHFRTYLLIASTNPVIAYYHDGYLRLAVEEYDAESDDVKTFVTNIGVNLKEEGLKGMTPNQIQEYTTWFLTKFHANLMDRGLVKDPNWLDNYLRPQFKKVMIHLTRMAQSRFTKQSSVHELFGLDFIMDADLGLWFIEANTMPLLDGFTKGSTILLNDMMEESFEIVFALLRSRTKRIIDYINKLTEIVVNEKYSSGEISYLEERRKEFELLTRNKFEPEFQVSANNRFQLIIDENVRGTKRYQDLLEQDCL